MIKIYSIAKWCQKYCKFLDIFICYIQSWMTLFVPHFYFKVKNFETLKVDEIISETQKMGKNDQNFWSHSLDFFVLWSVEENDSSLNILIASFKIVTTECEKKENTLL